VTRLLTEDGQSCDFVTMNTMIELRQTYSLSNERPRYLWILKAKKEIV